MPLLELPHTPGCLVCGPDNPHGLHLSLHVNPDTGIVHTTFTPNQQHIGFQSIPHGGILATILDEAMVWAATWQAKRFCLCAQLTVRFRHPAQLGTPLKIEARLTSFRPRLLQTESTITNDTNQLIATATGKYIPMPPNRHAAFVATLIPNPATARAHQHLAASL